MNCTRAMIGIPSEVAMLIWASCGCVPEAFSVDEVAIWAMVWSASSVRVTSDRMVMLLPSCAMVIGSIGTMCRPSTPERYLFINEV